MRSINGIQSNEALTEGGNQKKEKKKTSKHHRVNYDILKIVPEEKNSNSMLMFFQGHKKMWTARNLTILFSSSVYLNLLF